MGRWLRPQGIEIVANRDLTNAPRRLSALLAAGEPIDLVTVAIEHVAALARHLVPLEPLVSLDGLSVRAAGRCTWDGHLYALPRAIEVRLLWARRDQVMEQPTNWEELVAGGATFGFPGRGPELFHTFVEAYLSTGGRLIDDDGKPTYATPKAAAAIASLVRLARLRAPADQSSWRVDDVYGALAAGRVAMAQLGTLGWLRIRRSPYVSLLEAHPPLRGVSYGGGSCWAIPTTCSDVARSVELLQLVTGTEANVVDASAGMLPARLDAVDQADYADARDAIRLDLARQAAGGLVAPPPHPHLPGFEENAWRVLNRALRGELQPGDAAAALQQAATRILV
jgi:ABC-type glycerol-3-phosphate transport system substrate-binding protein